MNKEIKFAERKIQPFSEGIEKGLLILREIVAPLRHGLPFRIVIDYDPRDERSEITIQLPEKSLELHNQLEREYDEHLVHRSI